MTDQKEQKNNRLVSKLVIVVLAMFGFGYALVPIYNVFCEVTGIIGKTSNEAIAEDAYIVDNNRELTIEFITSLNESAPMTFSVETKKMKIHPGQYYTVNFMAKNLTNENMVARAIPSVSPGPAAEYLKKTECFCFTEQNFDAQEQKKMPVRFVIDPEIPERYNTITLAYTFFDNTKKTVN